MSTTWGQNSWGDNSWQSDTVTNQVTGLGVTSSVGSPEAFNLKGWGGHWLECWRVGRDW